jgi:hypothetical protein
LLLPSQGCPIAPLVRAFTSYFTGQMLAKVRAPGNSPWGDLTESGSIPVVGESQTSARVDSLGTHRGRLLSPCPRLSVDVRRLSRSRRAGGHQCLCGSHCQAPVPIRPRPCVLRDRDLSRCDWIRRSRRCLPLGPCLRAAGTEMTSWPMQSNNSASALS